MITSAPKLRSDLTVRRQETNGESCFILKDPVSGEFFRFREAERFIAEQFDGETPLEAVRKNTEEKFGATLPAETLNAFVKNLEKTGLLETEKTGKKRAIDKRGRIRGGPLYLRFKVFDPDRLFNRLVPRVRFFFTPLFMVLSAGLILLAVGELIANWGEFAQDLSRLYQLSAIPVFVAVVLVVVGAHEFAHGSTCKYFGGEVHEIGFLLVYFQPAFYCNVSDAWLFPEKSKRLWVGFAGPYFELFLWALATLVWRLTDEQTWINYLALIVMASSGVKTLLNFNPFIKLDGYYLLSDYLEIPNLRRKSFRYVGQLIKRLFGFAPPATEEVSPRTRRIYLMYGLIATVSSFSLLAYVLVSAANYAIEGRQPAAVLLSFGLLGLKLRRRLRRLFGKTSKSSDPDDDGDDFEISNAASSPDPDEPRKTPKKGRHSWMPRIVWMALAGVAVVGVFWGRTELRIAGPVIVLPIDNTDVRAAVEGIIDRIYVDEGDEVKAGELIARLSDKDLRAALNQTEAEIRELGARLQMLEAGPTAYEIEVAKATVGKAEDRVKYAHNRHARLQNLFKENLRSRNEYEDAEERAAAAENELVEANSRLTVLLRGTRPEEINAARAQADRLAEQRRYIQEQLRLLKIVSPTTGIVATPSRQLKEMRRVLVKKGDLILKVYDFKTLTAQILIPEKEIAGVQVGQKVVLRVRAFPDENFQGTVSSIATSAQAGAGSAGEKLLSTTSTSSSVSVNKTILVTTQLENRSLLLKPEMTGQAKIFCGQRRIVDLVTRRMARTFKVEFWSWW